ncbi:PAS domain-containing protein [Dongia rigui]|uniref:PAS domain-containing protein n=1 Tax=Dongia rigui TaxID=940149 RepID=A0ABU5DYG1_9PROT|nr:PAS domain-containing protein [Dongia rigui]MDY0872376.1 PAS domain-containing protein [Dongia rigui]
MVQTLTAKPLVIDPDTAAFLAGPADRRWRRFLGYWQDLFGRLGHWPRRRDVDPLEMGAELLGSIFLVDIERTDIDGLADTRLRYRFRLVGGEITARELVRPGMYLDAIGQPAVLATLERHYMEAIDGEIRLRRESLIWESRSKDHVHYGVMMLPLLGAADAVEHLIGCAIYEDERPRR